MVDSELKEILKGIKGFREFYPEDFAAVNYILQVMHKVSKKYGYEEYEGPSLEFAKLIEIKSGQALMEETFTLYDKEGRKLVLRPEQTPTLARMVVNQHQRYPKPMRWYSIPRIFRDETPQRGRVKEFFQFNADIIGIEHVSADAEIIALTSDIIRDAGLNDHEFVAVINSRELMQGFIEQLKIVNYLDIIRVIDSKEKYVQNYIVEDLRKQGLSQQKAMDYALLIRNFITQEEIKTNNLLNENELILPYLENIDEISRNVTVDAFKKNGLSNDQATQLYEFSLINGKPEEFLSKLNEKFELKEKALEGLKKLEQLVEFLKMFNVENVCSYDASIARGLDYYTGIVFEFKDKTGSVTRAIAGGGRYDQLVNAFGGGLIPAVGIGMGETVLLSILSELDRVPSYSPVAKVYVAPISK
ncbi:MAG: ATP phosphoribosyltransferase regulatory subunit, partial [Candidatus Heimdallarchaeaceae archaeon]